MQFLQPLLDWAISALGVYGIPIVLVATLLENLFIVGSVVPGDIITAAAAFAATPGEGGVISIWKLLAVATIGSMIGMNVSYFIGRIGGQGLIARMGPRFGISIESIEGAEEYFERHGALTILLARFVAVLKNISPAIAGAARMRIAVFEFFALVASLGYAAALMAVGWFLGENFRAGLKYFGAFSWLLLLAAVAAIAVASFGKRRHDRRVLQTNALEFERDHGRLSTDDDDGDGEGAGDDDA